MATVSMSSADFEQPVGVFDSGIGGLSILRAIRAQMPEERIVYFGDQAHIPYGPRPLGQVRDFSEGITRFLLDMGAKLIVVGCNAASAAALTYLRAAFQAVDFVGMEPAVKPAAEHTETGVVGVLATPATFQGELFASVVERFAGGVELLKDACPGLVQRIEAGDLDGPATLRILEAALRPMLARNIDTVVLGCTHYPFVIELIQSIVGGQVRVIDPAPAVAKQVGRLLERRNLRARAARRGEMQFFTSANVESMTLLLPRLLGEDGPVQPVRWADDKTLRQPLPHGS